MRRPMGARRGPGLLGTMARTAVIAGTATATSRAVVGHSERKQQERAAADQAAYEQQQQMATMQQQLDAQQPAATPSGGDLTGELQKLAALRDSGALSEQEFATAKSRLLGV